MHSPLLSRPWASLTVLPPLLSPNLFHVVQMSALGPHFPSQMHPGLQLPLFCLDSGFFPQTKVTMLRSASQHRVSGCASIYPPCLSLNETEVNSQLIWDANLILIGTGLNRGMDPSVCPVSVRWMLVLQLKNPAHVQPARACEPCCPRGQCHSPLT